MRLVGPCLLALLLAIDGSPARAVDYAADVKPILKQHCYSCHGSLRQKGGLRLDHVTFIRQGGDSGAAIAATSGESLLLRAVTGQGDVERMPLEAKPLSDANIATLRAWIDAGAPAPEEKLPDDPRRHWSFQRPVRPPLPAVQAAAWSEHPVDRFLAAEHQSRGLSPAAPAARQVLLRRVYLDLVGVPPLPSELRAFLADDAPGAYERVVDRLLASPQYGERWGRHWMDVWRYSDWDGYGAEVRESKPHIWRWRDWIIESLNADKPYDEMVRDMLAADELHPLDASAARAGGFLARNWFRFNHNVWMENTVEHTGKAFLGITLNCARCHDHMYDPILQTDYYQFRAFFEPYDVRADRVAGQTDTAKDALLRVYDAEASRPTYLFVRGNEAKPDKEHPLAAGVPAALGGEALKLEPVTMPPLARYAELSPPVQRDLLAQAQAEFDKAESSMAGASGALADAQKKLADFAAAKAAAAAPPATAQVNAATGAPAEASGDAAKAAPPDKQEKKPAVPAASEDDLKQGVADAEGAADVAEMEVLAASAQLAATRAKIAADNARFAEPPAADAATLAREASRAERVADVELAKRELAKLDGELSKARRGQDGAAKKKVNDLETKLAAAQKSRAKALEALGKAGDAYRPLGTVYPATSTGRRAALARWITSKDNPLAARVAVNHIWLRHFGTPLVSTVFDFGINGRRPTHPALLDWLACELMDHDWRMKHVHRLLVTSQAYRMASSFDDESNRARDPDNAYLWRMNSRRMEAEAVRDSTLCVAGNLDATMFGPELDQNQGLTASRRSVYFRSSKEKKVTFLEMFDSPNVTECYRRGETVAPQQALAMVNSALSLAESRRLAGLLASELPAGLQAMPPGPDSQTAFVNSAFERILCRPPSEAEATACHEFLATQAARLADPKTLAAFAAGGENKQKPAADPHARARENLVHVLLNHNDFVTVR